MSYLGKELFRLSDKEADKWTIDDAVKGTSIMGGTGSGKTSGSGKLLAHKFLKEGWGGLVLCAKTDEAELWEQYCKETGREKDRIIFTKGATFDQEEDEEKPEEIIFNPIDYEMKREGEGAAETQNLTNIFMNIYRMGNRIANEGDTKEERYWDTALKRCLNRVIELIKLSGEDLSYSNMVKVLSTSASITSASLTNYFVHIEREEGIKAPKKYQIVEEKKAKDEEESESEEEEEETENTNQVIIDEDFDIFNDKNYCFKCLVAAYYYTVENEFSENHDELINSFNLVEDYFTNILPSMGSRTKSIVTESFMGLAEPFLTGMLRRHFAGATNIYPEWTYQHQKIIILDFSIKEYLDAGIIAQSLFKLLFQQAVERRNTDEYPTPVFLWCDEAQYFVNPYDQIFLTTARSSRTATVFLSQNISNYFAMMGSGEDAKARVDSLMGNLSTKIFHANSDAVTNQYASTLIGSSKEVMATSNIQHQAFSLKDNYTQGSTTQYLPQIQPKEFTTFRTGGINNNYEVDGVVFANGRRWSDGKNFIQATFKQEFSEEQ